MLDGAAAEAHRQVRQELHAVGEDLSAEDRAVGPIVAGGKLMRAQLVLLCARLSDTPSASRALRYATALELIHAGALCHDDVVDRSAVRRSAPTLPALVGARAAVFAGLYLMVRAAERLAEEPAVLRRAVARAVREAARGQVDELGELFDRDVPPHVYTRRIRAKTGALYELAGYLGGRAGDVSPREADAMARFGSEFGVAFQHADDLRDFVGGAVLGREAGTDLRQGVYTLPVLLTVAGRCPGGDALGRLLDAREPDLVRCCHELLTANGAVGLTMRIARRHGARAIAALEAFPASRARRELVDCARGVIRLLPDACLEAESRPTPAAAATISEPSAAFGGYPSAQRMHAARDRISHPLPVDLLGAPVVARAVDIGATLLALGNELGSGACDRMQVARMDLVIADLFAVFAELAPRSGIAVTRALAESIREETMGAAVALGVGRS